MKFSSPFRTVFSRRPRNHDLPANIQQQVETLPSFFATFGLEVKAGRRWSGPSTLTVELFPASGTRLARLSALTMELGMHFQTQGVKLLAPVPGESCLGIEIPLAESEPVRLGDILPRLPDSYTLPLGLGLTSTGDPFYADLAACPHLLVGGSAGTGKSSLLHCCIFTILEGALRSGSNVRFVLLSLNPAEFRLYRQVDRFFHVAASLADISESLFSLNLEMDKRYQALGDAGKKNITDWKRNEETMPYIVCILDSITDILLADKESCEVPLMRLAGKARAAGINLLYSTAKPSSEFLPPLIKANAPARVSFRVPSHWDSRSILDTSGAEALGAPGDLLFNGPGTFQPLRLRAPLITDEEIQSAVNALATSLPS